MSDWRMILAPLLLLAQAPLVHWAAGGESAPKPPDLQTLPARFGGWRQFQEDPIAPDIGAALRADRLLSRGYLQTSTGRVASLFVAWFHSEREGASQPHSPKWCLPAAGWIPAAVGEPTLQTAAGAITINRYVLVKGAQRIVVLYWYQSSRRVTAGEWAAKFWLVVDAFKDKRTDNALVRVVAQSDGGGDQAADAAAAGFAQVLYPLLRQNLP